MAILLALAMALSLGGLTGGVPVAIAALIAAVVVTRPRVLYIASSLGHRGTFRRVPRIFARVRRASHSLQVFSTPKVIMLAGVLGVLGWMAEGYGFHLLLTWLGAETDMWLAIGIFTLATIVGGSQARRVDLAAQKPR